MLITGAALLSVRVRISERDIFWTHLIILCDAFLIFSITICTGWVVKLIRVIFVIVNLEMIGF